MFSSLEKATTTEQHCSYKEQTPKNTDKTKNTENPKTQNTKTTENPTTQKKSFKFPQF